jgi:hypothetical protein
LGMEVMVVVSCLATNPHSFSSRWRDPNPRRAHMYRKGTESDPVGCVGIRCKVTDETEDDDISRKGGNGRCTGKANAISFCPFDTCVLCEGLGTQPTGSLSVPTVPEPPSTDLTTVSRSSPSPPVSSALPSLPSCSSEAPVSSVAQEPDVATRLTSPSAPPPPHTMNTGLSVRSLHGGKQRWILTIGFIF